MKKNEEKNEDLQTKLKLTLKKLTLRHLNVVMGGDPMDETEVMTPYCEPQTGCGMTGCRNSI